MMGEFNMNIYLANDDNYQVNSAMKDKLLDFLLLADLKQTIMKSTKQVNGQKASLIDKAWVSNMTKHVKTNNIDMDSDHDMILTTVKTKGSVTNMDTFIRRDYANFNEKRKFRCPFGLFSIITTDLCKHLEKHGFDSSEATNCIMKNTKPTVWK